MIDFFISLIFIIALFLYILQLTGVVTALEFGDYESKLQFFISLIPFAPLLIAIWRIRK